MLQALWYCKEEFKKYPVLENAMEFWHNRWHTQQTGWHRAVYNDMLVKHWPSIGAATGSEVLVPLCGKSLDMLWLSEAGHQIIGLEMVEEAIQSFFRENNLQFSVTAEGPHAKYTSEQVTIFQGNVFDFESGMVCADAWYDRAAMIAVDPSMRQAYVEQIRQQTKIGAVGLLITFAYPQHQMAGPPFALHDEQVVELFADGFSVECLETISLDDDKDRGLSNVKSSVFKITRN
tara:strand:- start:112 stop:810 length:699 start_codon:yes stop_codon:yes gene_type:complete